MIWLKLISWMVWMKNKFRSERLFYLTEFAWFNAVIIVVLQIFLPW